MIDTRRYAVALVGAIAMSVVLAGCSSKPNSSRVFVVQGSNMERTLHGCEGCTDDKVLVDTSPSVISAIGPGDILVFKPPPGWLDGGSVSGFLSRVIAVGGQTVRGVSSDGGATARVEVSDNGAAGPWRTLNEPYVYLDGPDANANFGPVTIPKGRLWVMGDHRNDSADSRFHCGSDASLHTNLDNCDATSSTVPVNDVIGKVAKIVFPNQRVRTF